MANSFARLAERANNRFGKVGAGDEQQHPNRRQQHHEDGLNLSCDDLGERNEDGPQLLVRVRVLLLETSSQRIHHDLRLVEGYPGFEPAERVKPV